MSAQSNSPSAIRLIVPFVVVVVGTILLVPNPLEAQQPPEQKKERPKAAPDPQEEALAKIKQKLEKIDPSDDELRKLLKERWTIAIRRYDLAKDGLDLNVGLLPIFRSRYYESL
jgi:hypothetical protein